MKSTKRQNPGRSFLGNCNRATPAPLAGKGGLSPGGYPFDFFHMCHFNGKIRGKLLMSFSAFKNCWASGSLDMSFCNFSIIQTWENLLF